MVSFREADERRLQLGSRGIAPTPPPPSGRPRRAVEVDFCADGEWVTTQVVRHRGLPSLPEGEDGMKQRSLIVWLMGLGTALWLYK